MQNITIGSHANDGDIKHLRDALSSLDASALASPAAVEATSLCARLDAEVLLLVMRSMAPSFSFSACALASCFVDWHG